MTHPTIFCVFGFHNWKKIESKNAGGIAELGGYIFFPNTETVYQCDCYKKMSIITDYKGDFLRYGDAP